jgi:mRNA interferase MazF
MTETIKTSISIQKPLLNEAEIQAQQMNISRNRLFELALEQFIRNRSGQALPDERKNQAAPPSGDKRLVINQGDVFWVQLDDANGSEGSIPHPHVVIQDNVFNHSRIHTVVACALTSNIKRANLPGNVLLDVGEANLAKQSVVEASKVSSVDKMALGEYIGSLSEGRVNQILAGMRLLERSFFTP